VGAYQELFLNEIREARRKRDINVYFDINGAYKILESYVRELESVLGPISLTPEQLLLRLVEKCLLLAYPDGKLRTIHMELISRAIFSRSYPSALSTLEYLILEPRITPLPSFEERTGIEVIELLKEYFSSLTSEDVAEKLARVIVESFAESIAGKSDLREGILSEYQYANLRTMLYYLRENLPSITLLAAPTGTGKTWIFTLYAVIRVLEAKLKGEEGVKVVIIYPRKALSRDQTERILKFLDTLNSKLKNDNRLKQYRITLGLWDGDSPEDWESCKDSTFRGIICPHCKREDATLIYLKKGGKWTIGCKCGRTYDFVGDVREWIYEVKPDILITNYWALNQRLLSSKYKDLLSSSIRCIILDEAHVLKDLEGAFVAYLLARVLLRLSMMHKNIDLNTLKPNAEYNALVWINDYVKERNFAIILSSATISTAPSLNERRKDANNFARNVILGGIFEIFEKTCKSKGVGPLIYCDYEETYHRRRITKSGFNKLCRKIEVPIIIAPHPLRGAETIAQSVLICTLFWAKVFNKSFLFFADNKEALERIHHFINDIIISERGEIYDHNLLTDKNPGTHISEYIRRIWLDYREYILKGRDPLIKVLSDPLYWISFEYCHYLRGLLMKNSNLEVALSSICRNQNACLEEVLKRTKLKCDDLFKNVHKYIKIHHADLKKDVRQRIERELKEGRLLGALCTSTLELGVDIDKISVIVQYRPPLSAESFVQRLGRAGRKREATMCITIGFLLLSNLDVLFLNEDYARKALFEVRPQPLPISNSRIQANAVYYTVFDILTYFGSKIRFRKDVRNVRRIADNIYDIFQLLMKFKKAITSIIATSLGLSTDLVEKEYNMLVSHLEILHNCLRGAKQRRQELENVLYEGWRISGSLMNSWFTNVIPYFYLHHRRFKTISPLVDRISEKISYIRDELKLEKLLGRLYDLCYIDPVRLLMDKDKILKHVGKCSSELSDLIEELKRLLGILRTKNIDAQLYSKVKRVLGEAEKLANDIRELTRIIGSEEIYYQTIVLNVIRVLEG